MGAAARARVVLVLREVLPAFLQGLGYRAEMRGVRASAARQQVVRLPAVDMF
jgi:hypothetical protein